MANNWLIEQSVHLDQGAATPMVWPNGLMLTGDNLAHVWQVRVYQNGAAADLAGAAATGYFVRADGNTVVIQGSITGNMISVSFAQACYAIAGELSGVLRLTTGEQVVTLSALIFRVRNELTDSIIDPGEVIPSLDALLGQIAAMEAASQDAEDAAAAANSAAEEASAAAQAAEDAEIMAAAFVGDDLVFSRADLGTVTIIGGKTALKGEQGDQGVQGATGATGAQGIQGAQGDAFEYSDFTAQQLLDLTGPQGAQGAQGIQGATGAQGAQGIQGIQGETGAQGAQGAQGIQGIQGAAGDTGAAGDSAYDQAVTGGYTDTEAHFLEDLAAIEGLAAVLAAL